MFEAFIGAGVIGLLVVGAIIVCVVFAVLAMGKPKARGDVDPGEKSFVDNAEGLQQVLTESHVDIFSRLIRHIVHGDWLALRQEATDLFFNLRDKEYRADNLVLPMAESHARQLLNDEIGVTRLQVAFRAQGWELTRIKPTELPSQPVVAESPDT